MTGVFSRILQNQDRGSDIPFNNNRNICVGDIAGGFEGEIIVFVVVIIIWVLLIRIMEFKKLE